MRKNYRVFLFLLFLLHFGNAFAQNSILANDDIGDAPAGAVTQLIVANVIANDSIFEHSILLSDVILTQLSTSNPALQLQADGSVILSGGPIPNGVYTLNYQICNILYPSDCDSATVTVFVGICHVSPPIVNYVSGLNCNASAIVSIGGLPPATNWTLELKKNGVFVSNIPGNGPATALSFTSSGIYSLRISDDGNACQSPEIFFEIYDGPVCGFHLWYNGTYNDFNSNGVVDSGDTVNYNFTVRNNTSNILSGISLSSATINIAGGPIASLNASAVDNATFTAVYAITQNDIDLGVINNSATATGTANSNTIQTSYGNAVYLPNVSGIRMRAFVDANNNGVWDSSEHSFNNGAFIYEKNNDGVSHFASWFGQTPFIFESNPLNSYNLSFIVNSSVSAYYTVTTSGYTNISVGSGVVTYTFAVTEVPYLDSAIYLTQTAQPRPGISYKNLISFRNNSNTAIASGTLAFVKDNLLTISNISQAGTVATVNGFTYNFTNLLPNELRIIEVTMQVPPIPVVALGNLLSNSVQISVPPGDVNALNNSASLSSFIVGSYDPNEKSENHGGKVLYSAFGSDDYLTYTIQFENTGTANAINVKVEDLLDDQLDETTVCVIIASQAYSFERVGRNLIWKFNGIDLPPSVANTDTGHGYIVFQVKPKPGYAVGDIIPNTADIYFDFNPAIVTDTCMTAFVSTLRTADYASADFRFYPNPVKNKLSIYNKTAIQKIVITSLLGQEILVEKIDDKNASLDLSGLATGIYLVSTTSAGITETFKIIKD